MKKSLVEETAMNSTTDGELPVTMTEDGFEATAIASAINKHLNLVEAIKCVTARVYFANAFGKLNAEDQAAFIAANDLVDLVLVAKNISDDFEDQNPIKAISYMLLEYAAEGADEFDFQVRQRVHREIPLDQLEEFSVKAYNRNEELRTEK